MSVEMASNFPSNTQEEDYFLNVDALDNVGGSSLVGDTSCS